MASCSQTITNLAAQTPFYDSMFLKDWKPLDSPLMGRHESGVWKVGTSDVHYVDRIQIGQPDLNVRWGQISSQGCVAACTAPKQYVNFGSTRSSYYMQHIDLYSQFQFLHPDIIGIGSLSAFKARYIEFGGFENKQPIGFKNIDELMDLIRPFVFKRTTAECGLNLPPTYTQIRSVPLSVKQRALYNKIRKEKLMYIKTLDENLVIESVMDAYNKLQQVVGGFLIYETGETETTGRGNIRILKETERVVEPEHNPKIAEMLKILTEHPGKSTIIWAKFTEEVNLIIEALERKFGAGSVSRFDGEVKDADREDQKKAFLEGRTQFFVSKASSGGKGLTLNISDLVIYFSNSFKFVDREQSRKRNDRIGQTKTVTYIDLVAEDTIDEDILATLKDKKDLADFVKEQLTARAPLLTK